MGIYALIGGRSIENINNPTIEKKIFGLLGINNPNILFFPFACLDDMQKAYQKFINLMNGVKCKIDILDNLTNEEEVINKIHKADVLYFGGGHADDLVKTIKNSFLLSLLKELDNKVFIGISAGAILFSKSGMGDRNVYTNAYQNYNYSMVEGIGLVNITVCPHYDHNGLWCYNDIACKYNYDGYALEDDTAIIFINNKVIPIKQDKRKSIYFFDKSNKYQMIPLYEVCK